MSLANIGQIIYNVDGVPNTGTTGEHTLFEILTNGIIGTNGILDSSQIITKLSVQGEPGLKLVINNNEIMIGRTGIYELDEKIIVNSLRIIPIRKYRRDDEKTVEAQKAALEIFKNIDFEGSESYKLIQNEFNTDRYTTTTKEKKHSVKEGSNNTYDITDWVKLYENNNAKFNLGYIQYLQGINGIYVPVNNDPTSETAYEKINNLIIDYVYETGQA